MAEQQKENKLRLRLVTPQQMLYEDDVDMVIMRTATGDLGALYGHEALTTALGYGIMRVMKDGVEYPFSVLGGFVEVNPHSITILSDAAEDPREIDKDRAVAAKERAERLLRDKMEGVDERRASLALRRALVRIEASTYPLIGNTQNYQTTRKE